jgi:hypothetical protein
MIFDIASTFDKNFGRLRNLVELYESLASGKGRKSVHSLDLLRVTTVLAHATLEDYLRSLMTWQLPLADKEKLRSIPITKKDGANQSTKFEMSDLIDFRGRTVDDLIALSIKEHLSIKSFNSTDDLVGALKSLSVAITPEIKITWFSDNFWGYLYLCKKPTSISNYSVCPICR